jgi:hypothetical protein
LDQKGQIVERIELMGPPNKGPYVTIYGAGIKLTIQVNDEIDAEIVGLGLGMAQRRRYGLSSPNQPESQPESNEKKE